MNVNLIRLFFRLSGLLLLVAAIAKLASSAGSSRILQNSDPIFSISFQHLFWFVGSIELIIALLCLLCRRTGLQAGLVAWLATSILIYRIGLVEIGYHKPCSCLGNLTDALHVPPKTADTAMQVILVYLLGGSYAILFWLWRQRRNTNHMASSSEAAAGSVL